MFFLLRSAFCIALVVALLPEGAPGRPDAATVVAAGQHVGTMVGTGVQTLCRIASDRCVAAASATLQAGLGPRGVRGSRDSLLPADLTPPWAGPADEPRG